MLYSYKNQYPQPLPHRIVLSSGRTRTDASTFTRAEILDAGYVPTTYPPQAEYPNRVDWTGTEWIVREPNPGEIQQQVQQVQATCQRLLFETDYKVIKAVEQGLDVDPDITTYRQQLRDLYNTVADGDVWNIVWPVLKSATDNVSDSSVEYVSDDTSDSSVDYVGDDTSDSVTGDEIEFTINDTSDSSMEFAIDDASDS
jgi:hypothetical protein